MSQDNKKGKLFYGWIVVICLFLMSMGPIVWLSNFYGYYQYAVCEELGCSYVQFNLGSTAATIVGMLFSVFLASKVATTKTRYWMLGGGILCGVCLYLVGNCNNIYTLIAVYALGNLGYHAYALVPVNVLISKWFVDKRATVTSIVMAGMSVGGIIFTPVVSSLISKSWRLGFHVTGIVILVVPLILTWFLKSPEEMGLSPLMPKETAKDTATKETAAVWEGVSKKDALKSSAFYFYAIVCICCGLIGAGVMIQIPTFFIENGIDYSSRMTVYNVFGLIGLLVMGRVFDKLGLKAGGTITGLMLLLSMISLLLVGKYPVFSYVAMILNPLGGSITTLGPPLIAGNVFGMKDYGGIYGLGNTCFMFGCMLGPLLASTIRSISGSFNAAWIVFAALSIIIIICIFASTAAGKKLIRQQ